MQAVCFDVDCTCTVNDSLDLLAEFMGVGSSVASITSSAMDGTMALEDALEERLRIINCSPQVTTPCRTPYSSISQRWFLPAGNPLHPQFGSRNGACFAPK